MNNPDCAVLPMRVVTVFVSSPGDVEFERQRIERVAERLNGEMWPHVRFATVRWETKFYSAHKSFQEHIPEAAACDIVIAIFWSRLGTELSDRLAAKFHMPDGRPYPSGTAYEVLTAIEARKTADHPDVYVFRKTEVPTVPLNNMAQHMEAERQWQRLADFLANSFRAPDGSFLAAHHEFKTTDEFEEHVEKLLLDWLNERFQGGKTTIWPIQLKGSPFRGLAPFDAKHAPVFFGRMRKVMRAVDHLKDAARRSFDAPERPEANPAERRLKPFLLIVGPSGAGKSSLMRAGLAPRITAPGVVSEIDHWRIAVMRPGDGASSFEALVRALLVTGKGDDPGGFGRALPEISDGDKLTAEALIELFKIGEPVAARVVAALDRVASDVRKSAGFERAVRADLLLLVDQLEDIFAANVNDTQRSGFAHLLSALCATKRVWVVATLRGDLYNRLIKNRAFLALKDAGHTYDLAPPGPDELGEIIQRSAEAAGLVYDTDPATGERLDDRLLKDAEGKDILPLLQFTLDRLFEERDREGQRLTFASYRTMGGLGGAINQSAEQAIHKVEEAELAALPRLLRSLAVTVREDAGTTGASELTVRAAPLDEVVTDEATRRLVNALLEARIVLTSRSEPEQSEEERSDTPANKPVKPTDKLEAEGAGVLRIAHQRVFECWERARKIMHDHRDYFRIRSVVEDQRRRWKAMGRTTDLLVPDGRPLDEAESLISRYSKELPGETVDFVFLSGRRARRNRKIRRAMQVSLAAAAVLAIAAGGFASYFAFQAVQNEQRAITNFTAARETVDSLVTSVFDRLRDLDRLPVHTVDEALMAVSKLVDLLEKDSRGDPTLKRTRATMQYEIAKTFQTADNNPRALDEARIGLTLRADLAKLPPPDPEREWDLALSLDQVGDIERFLREFKQADDRYRQAFTIRQRLRQQHPDIVKFINGLSQSLVRIGDLKVILSDQAKLIPPAEANEGARADYEQAMQASIDAFRREPDEDKWQRELSWTFQKVGVINMRLERYADALDTYQNSLCIRRYMSSRADKNTLWKRDVAFSLEKVSEAKQKGGDLPGANEPLFEALSIRRALASSDPTHTLWARELADTLHSAGNLRRNIEDWALAAGFYLAAIDVASRTLQRSPENRQLPSRVENSRKELAIAIERLRATAPSPIPSDAVLQERASTEETISSRRIFARQENPLACWSVLMESLDVPLSARPTAKLP